EATARFKAGLMQLRTSGELATLLKPQPQRSFTRYALAAGVVLALLVVGIGMPRWQGGSAPLLVASLTSLVDQRGSSLPVARTYTLLTTRSREADAVIELPATRQAIELRVLPDT